MYVTNFYVGYLLSRIIYTYKANRNYLFVKNSIQIQSLLYFLWRKGFIQSYYVCDLLKIKIYLKYYDSRPIFSSFNILSKPGYRIFYNMDKLRSISNRKLLVISTNNGLLTPLECISRGIGGEAWFEIL